MIRAFAALGDAWSHVIEASARLVVFELAQLRVLGLWVDGLIIDTIASFVERDRPVIDSVAWILAADNR